MQFALDFTYLLLHRSNLLTEAKLYTALPVPLAPSVKCAKKGVKSTFPFQHSFSHANYGASCLAGVVGPLKDYM